MNDLVSAIVSAFVLFLGSLVIGGILYILVKHYVKSRL